MERAISRFLVIYSLPSLKKMISPLLSPQRYGDDLLIIQVAYGAWFGSVVWCVARVIWVCARCFAIEPRWESLIAHNFLLVSHRLLQNKATKYDIVALCLMFVALY